MSPCSYVRLPNGMVAIVKHAGAKRKQCVACGGAAGFLCDWKMEDGKTCDAGICAEHGKTVGHEKHLCPEHQKAWKRHPRFRP